MTQYFYLDKTTQINSNEQGKSINTTYIDIELAKWSHISNPCIGTTQNDGVHQVYYYEKQFQEIDYLYFEVVGRPGKNWNTNNSIIGGSEW